MNAQYFQYLRILFFLGKYRMARITILGDETSPTRFVLFIMTPEAPEIIRVATMVRVRPPTYLHIGVNILNIGILHTLDSICQQLRLP